ncbi:hypothetical protein VIB_001643 [Vibrio metschnikovii CIP 69.14]|nr:hypothetical protein VIB_001643 [Vibrio metschnikovii CIP 69.14]
MSRGVFYGMKSDMARSVAIIGDCEGMKQLIMANRGYLL